MRPTILDEIIETKRKEVADLRRRSDLQTLRQQAIDAPAPRNFYQAVTKKPRRLLNLIAEVKKASPSAGVIREHFDPVWIARQYAAAGADAISVLTDEKYFQGHIEYLRAVREAVSLPVLRKDFIIDPLQVYEARAAGADAVLLIAAALTLSELTDLSILATELRMTVLLEVHEADELMQVRPTLGFPHARYSLLGINNRNLHTFKVDLGTTLRLAELAEEGTPIISESGIKTRQDIQRLAAAGVKAVLVGETLMRQDDMAAAVQDLLGQPRTA
jgi:indole-3-glycerol phosphate synthase